MYRSFIAAPCFDSNAALRSCLIPWVRPPFRVESHCLQLAIGTGSFSLMRLSVLLMYNTNQPIILIVARWLGFQRGSSAGNETSVATDADLPAR